MSVGIFHKGNIDGGSQLALSSTPSFGKVVCKVLDLIVFFSLVVWSLHKGSVHPFIFEKVLNGSLALVHVVVHISHPLHLRHLFDVVNHVQIWIPPLVLSFRSSLFG